MAADSTDRTSADDKTFRDHGSGGAPVRYVTSSEVLGEVCETIRGRGRFGFDTEFVMEDRYTPEICLVQLATDGVVALVDPTRVADLSPIWQIVADPEVEVIVHAGMEDLALCQSQGGLTPKRVFDCQIAWGLVSVQYPLSLSRMVRSLLGIRLHKSQTMTDWRRRPLSPEQIQYAADDVAHLPAMHDDLSKRLAERDRSNWMREEMARFDVPETYVRDASDNVLRLKGAGSLDGKGLAIARELIKARQELALRYDRPVRAVVRDHLVIEIAKHGWTTASQIKTLRGLNLRAEGIRELASAAQRAARLPREQWPATAPPDDETDQEAAMAMLIGAVIRAYSANQEIAHQLIASKKDIRAHVAAFTRRESARLTDVLQSGWRAGSVGAVLRDVLEGRSYVGIDAGAPQPRIAIR